MFSFEGKDRPTVEEIKNHPWMKVPINMKEVRHDLLSQLAEKRIGQTDSTKNTDGNDKRGPEMLELIRQSGYVQKRKFNDMSEFEI